MTLTLSEYRIVSHAVLIDVLYNYLFSSYKTNKGVAHQIARYSRYNRCCWRSPLEISRLAWPVYHGPLPPPITAHSPNLAKIRSQPRDL